MEPADQLPSSLYPLRLVLIWPLDRKGHLWQVVLEAPLDISRAVGAPRRKIVLVQLFILLTGEPRIQWRVHVRKYSQLLVVVLRSPRPWNCKISASLATTRLKKDPDSTSKLQHPKDTPRHGSQDKPFAAIAIRNRQSGYLTAAYAKGPE
jgi:hypothetical protein